MFKILEVIHEHSSQFPCIQHKELLEIKKQLSLVLEKIQRFHHIPPAYRTLDEQKLLQEEPLFNLFSEFSTSKSKFCIIEVLLSETVPINRISTLLWSELITQHMFLENKEESFNLFINCETIFYTPTAFSGLLDALLKIYPIDKIIHSGILQRYFALFVMDIDSIHQTYQLLKDLSVASPIINEFLYRLEGIHCGLGPFPQMNLLGQTSDTYLYDLELVESPRPVIECSTKQFLDLYYFLGLEFLKLSLLNTELDYLRDYFDELEKCLNQEPIETLIDLFNNILHSLPTHEQYMLFLHLCPLLKEKTIHDLLQSKKNFFWLLVGTSPGVYKFFSKKQLHQLCLEHPLQANEIQYVHHACTRNHYFHKIEDNLYFQILKIFLLNPDLELEFSILQKLKQISVHHSWLEDHAKHLRHELLEVITSNLDDFDYDKFKTIRDTFFKHQSQRAKLKELHFTLTDYPENHYHLTSVILSKLYLNSRRPDILNWIKQLIPFHLHEPEHFIEFNDHQQRLLIEWLNYTHQPEIILRVMTLLVDIYDKNIYQLEMKYLLNRNLNLKRLAATDANCLRLYTHLFPKEKFTKIILYQRPTQKSIFEQSFSNEDLIPIILENQSPQDILKLLVIQNIHHQHHIILLAQHPQALKIYLSFIPEEHLSRVLKIKNHFLENVFCCALKKTASVEVLCEIFHEKDIFLSLFSKNRHGFSVFENALNYPESCKILISYLSNASIIKLLNQINPLSTKKVFAAVLEKQEILKILTQKLSSQELVETIVESLEYLLNKKGSHSELFNILFEYLSHEEIHFILNYTIHNTTCIHHLARFPETLFAILRLVKQEDVFALLSQSSKTNKAILCDLFHSSPDNLHQIIEQIHPRDFLSLITFDLTPQKKMIDYIASHPPLLMQVIANTSPADGMFILEFKNFLHARSIDLFPLHDWMSLNSIMEKISNLDKVRLITAKPENEQDSIFIRSLHFPDTLAYILRSIELENILDCLGISSAEPFCNQLFKCMHPQSIHILLNYFKEHEEEQAIILFHKHKKNNSILQFVLSETSDLPSLLETLHPKIIHTLHQKIINHQINARNIIFQPELFHLLLTKFTKEQQKTFLLFMADSYPDLAMTKKYKHALSSIMGNSSEQPHGFFKQPKPLIDCFFLFQVKTFKDLIGHIQKDEAHDMKKMHLESA